MTECDRWLKWMFDRHWKRSVQTEVKVNIKEQQGPFSKREPSGVKMEPALEDMQKEVKGALYKLTKYNLIEISDILEISSPDQTKRI